jgi:S1-C subfamily serine protease
MTMPIRLCRQIAAIAVILCGLSGCGRDAATPQAAVDAPPPDNRVAEPWMAKPKTEWPQIVLTNMAQFDGHSPLQGASSFLIKTDDGRILGATAAHLVGSAGGVEPEIDVKQLTSKIVSWQAYPRTMPDDFVEFTGLGVDGIGDESGDWLILSVKDSGNPPAYPLKVRGEPVAVGENVFLIGCAYVDRDCKQNVYSGVVTAREFGDRFRYDIDPPVDIRGFSGAPIVDAKGYVVGVMAIWFQPRMTGEKYLEAGAEDVATIYPLLQATD